ncbi:hypothetical protein [Nitrosomonas aestuarii]|uniref:hypothetical protein n=1 Tax=Nitrosomonas aestuarii TaxID=52441 RepID=UPI0015E773B1|nr:hypothetical protein [Nitrosomonas aestuarii]
MSAEAVRLIGQMDKDSESVFNLQTSQVNALFRKAVKRSVIDDLNFDDTRAEAITWLSAKVDILTLARITGSRWRMWQGVFDLHVITELANLLFLNPYNDSMML